VGEPDVVLGTTDELVTAGDSAVVVSVPVVAVLGTGLGGGFRKNA